MGLASVVNMNKFALAGKDNLSARIEEPRSLRFAPTSAVSDEVHKSLVHCDADRLGGNAVRHYFERTWSLLSIGRNIEVSKHDRAARGYSHGAVIVRLKVENVLAGIVRDSHQGIIRSSLKFVTERGCLR